MKERRSKSAKKKYVLLSILKLRQSCQKKKSAISEILAVLMHPILLYQNLIFILYTEHKIASE